MVQSIEVRAGCVSLAEVERELIEATLAHFEGHRMRTAAVLGISEKTLYNRLREYAGADAALAMGRGLDRAPRVRSAVAG